MSSREVIDQVSQFIAKHSDITVHYDPDATVPTQGSFVPVASLGLHADLAKVLNTEIPNGLYRHQALAVKSILSGRNTVVATQTSSGKSLIYSLPVFDSLLHSSDSTALFIYPQKALANDQLSKLQDLGGRIPTIAKMRSSAPYLISRYDGSTPQIRRPEIRHQAQILLTNPDMLHMGILPHHESKWAFFFRQLRFIIIDECHEYRGIFGTNVSYILRRLRQICELHKASPTFVATSATIREPKEHLEKLTGLPFTAIGPETDGSVQGRKKFWMLSGNDHYYDFGRKFATGLAKQGLTVLAFCPSRLAAEKMVARVHSAKDDESVSSKVYRAGLTPEERESIEIALRNKQVRLVFSTSALELGIDIGALDVVVCIGLPSSMMSLWQRSGRVARAGKQGAIVLIPADTPIDSYYACHPDDLFAKENEPLALNLANRRVAYCQYACAVSEVGGVDENLHFEQLGEAIETVSKLRTGGGLDDDIFYHSDPHSQVSIRSMGYGSYRLTCGTEQVGEIDEFHLLREAYRNAIYRHGGVGYRVKDVIKGKRIIQLIREFSWNETSRNSVAEYSGVSIATANIDVTEFIVSVVEKDRSGKIARTWLGSAGMPAHTLPTVATQILIHKHIWDEATSLLEQHSPQFALASCERLFLSLFPTITGPCDTQDFSSYSEVSKDGNAIIYLYDNVYDGADLTTGAFHKIEPLVEKCIERLQTCGCEGDEGCFRCIANPRVDEATSKEATMHLLSLLRALLSDEEPRIIEHHTNPATVFAPDILAPCPLCHGNVARQDRFCRNCGHPLS
jgi:DEAD/DEAH box helicase domain-containing protein